MDSFSNFEDCLNEDWFTNPALLTLNDGMFTRHILFQNTVYFKSTVYATVLKLLPVVSLCCQCCINCRVIAKMCHNLHAHTLSKLSNLRHIKFTGGSKSQSI